MLSKFTKNTKTQELLVYEAVSKGQTEVVKRLVEQKTDINLKDPEDQTPLQIALDKRNHALAELLIQYKADLNLKYGHYDRTLLHIALDSGREETAKFLIEQKTDIHLIDGRKQTALHRAANNGYREVAKRLIECKVSVNFKDKNNEVALHLAMQNNRSSVARLLIEEKADVHTVDQKGNMPLHQAIQKSDADTLGLLLDHKATIDVLNSMQKTPLMMAAEQKLLPIMENLLQAKANVNFKNKRGQHALFYAVQANQLDAVKTLVKWKAVISSEDLKAMPKNDCEKYLRALEQGEQTAETIGMLNKQGYLTISFKIRADDLTVGEILGSGTYGLVSVGTYDFNQVALKKLKTELFTKEREQEFLREASVMASIKSNYLVNLLGVCMDAPNYFMVMEMYRVVLSHLLQQPSIILTYSLQIQIGFEIAAGLSHLHKRSILHRDLKSINVLLTKYEYHAKLCDFGLVNIRSAAEGIDEKAVSNTVVGTLQWMSPEILQGIMQSEASDVYALGLVLWELVTQKVPFRKERIEIINGIQVKDLLLELKAETCQAWFISKRQTPPKAETLVDHFVALEKNEFKAQNRGQVQVLDLFKYVINQKLKDKIGEIVKAGGLPVPSQAHPGLVKEIKSCCQYESIHRPSAQLVTQNLFELWQTEKKKVQKEVKNETVTTAQTKKHSSIPEKLTILDKIFHTSTVHLLALKAQKSNPKELPLSGIKLDEGVTNIHPSQVASLSSSMRLQT